MNYFLGCSNACCTCSNDGADVSATQTSPADSRPGDVGPVDHLLQAVVGHSDHHAVLREEETTAFIHLETLSKSLLSEATERQRPAGLGDADTDAEKNRVLKYVEEQLEDCSRATRNAHKWFNYIHDKQ